MSATTVTFNGVTTSVPGAMVRQDFSNLDQPAGFPRGTVVLIGSGEGGAPTTATTDPEDFIRIRSPGEAVQRFRSGDLLEAALFALAPRTDPRFPGAREVICLKTNQATRSTGTLNNSVGAAMSLTSDDYGAYTDQINVQVLAPSGAAGRNMAVILDALTESGTDIGLVDGSAGVFSLRYDEPAVAPQGWDTMRADMTPRGIIAYGTRTDAGQSTQTAAGTPMAVADTVEVLAGTDSAAMRSKNVILYGVSGGVAVSVSVSLDSVDATTPVLVPTTFTDVLGAYIDMASGNGAATDQNLVVRRATGGAVIMTVAAGVEYPGVVPARTMYVGNTTVHLTSSSATPHHDGSGAAQVLLFGRNSAGALTAELVTVTGTTAIRSSTSWSELQSIVLGEVGTGVNVTVRAIAAQTTHGTHDTLIKAADHFNARSMAIGASTFGFSAEILTGQTTMPPAEMDYTLDAGSTGTLNIDGAAGEFTGILYALEQWFETSSVLVDGVRTPLTQKVYTATVTGVAGGAYTINIDGNAVTYTAAGTETITEIRDELVARVNRTATVMNYVSASAGTGAGDVVLTGLTPRASGGFVASIGAGSMTIALTVAQAGSGLPPDTMVAPLFLFGGTEGTATVTDFINAFTAARGLTAGGLKFVPLSGSPAVHGALGDHLTWRATNGVWGTAAVGLSAVDGSGNPTNVLPTKTSIKTQIRGLNSYYIQAVAESFDRYDSTGTLRTFLPWFRAAALAGAEASSELSETMTYKSLYAVQIYRDSSWSPVTDADELLRAGLTFSEASERGFRIVRSLTTDLSTPNLAKCEMSVVETWTVFSYAFRQFLLGYVGEVNRGVVSLNAVIAAARGWLNERVKNREVVSWNGLVIGLVGDRLQVTSLTVVVPAPINFGTANISFDVPSFSIAA